MLSRTGAWVRAGGLLAVVLAIDQVTKALVRGSLGVGNESRVLPGLLKLVHVRNRGIAFGALSGGGGLLLAFTLIAVAALSVLLTARPGRRGLWLATGLLIGGAMGNLIDRLSTGSVTDFIKVPHWPAFNVADMAITAGVLALLYVLEPAREKRDR